MPLLLPDLPTLLPGVAILRVFTALRDHPSTHPQQRRLRECPHPALDKTLVCLQLHLAGITGAQKPWRTTNRLLYPQPSPQAQDTASKVASPSLATILMSRSSAGMKILRRHSK